MRVLVLGKVGAITRWAESAVAGFRAAGHDVRWGVTRDPRVGPALERMGLSRWRAGRIATEIARFAPELIVAVDAFGVPAAILERLKAVRGRGPLVGWVGDSFGIGSRSAAGCLDLVAYTDSGFVDRHHSLGFPGRAILLPHAANPALQAEAGRATRSSRMVFIGTPTPHRLRVVRGLDQPIDLHGPAWTLPSAVLHCVHPTRVGPEELRRLYRMHLAVLNMRSEGNVVNGLNQRNFDPYLCATPVVAEDQPDLTACFEPGKEVVVWRDVAELNAIYSALRQDPARAAAIGLAGQRRVLADHSYGRRLEILARELGI